MDIYQKLAVQTLLNKRYPGLLDNDGVHTSDNRYSEHFMKGAEDCIVKSAVDWGKWKGHFNKFLGDSNAKNWGTGALAGGGLGLLYALATMSKDRGALSNFLRVLIYGALGGGVGGLGHMALSGFRGGADKDAPGVGTGTSKSVDRQPVKAPANNLQGNLQGTSTVLSPQPMPKLTHPVTGKPLTVAPSSLTYTPEDAARQFGRLKRNLDHKRKDQYGWWSRVPRRTW